MDIEKTRFNDNDNHRGIEGFFKIKDGKLIFFVEATNHFWDWVVNFLPFIRTKVYGRRVHYLYYRGARWLVDYLREAIGPNMHEVVEVEAHGHSKGAGEAEIAAWLIYQEWHIQSRLFTYGGARGMSHGYEDAVHYEHRGDPVPYLPFWPLYRRKGERIRFGEVQRPFSENHVIKAYEPVISI